MRVKFGVIGGVENKMAVPKRNRNKAVAKASATTKKPVGKIASTKHTKAISKVASMKHKKRIPPPPGPETSWDEQADYEEKYSVVEQEEAGYLEEVKDKKFLADLAKSARAQRLREQREQVNISLESVQYAKLKKLAKRKHLSPSTLARCWLLERLTDESA
jgi:hypothetical protein